MFLKAEPVPLLIRHGQKASVQLGKHGVGVKVREMLRVQPFGDLQHGNKVARVVVERMPNGVDAPGVNGIECSIGRALHQVSELFTTVFKVGPGPQVDPAAGG